KMAGKWPYCATEADVAITVDFRPHDVGVTIDSVLLIYTSVKNSFRPFRRSRFLAHDKFLILAAVSLTERQLLVLGIVSKKFIEEN
ncbi:hypothetical protein BGW42_007051, partial [Actinomortierella wolfii]